MVALIAICLPEELGSPGDVDGDPSRLVAGQNLRLPRLGFVLPAVDVRERLPVGVPRSSAAAMGSADPRQVKSLN